MSDDIKIGIGVDAKGFKAGVGQVMRDLSDLKKQTKEGFFDLEGEKRVERNLGAMVQGLANATSGAEALAIGLDRIENVFKSSLGASVAVAVVGTLINKFLEAKAAADAFKVSFWESVSAANSAMNKGDGEALEGILTNQLKAIEKERKRLDGWMTKFVSSIGFGYTPGSAEENALTAAISAADRTRTELKMKHLEKDNAAALKAADELNGLLLKEELQGIEERNKVQDEAYEKEIEARKKGIDELQAHEDKVAEDDRKWQTEQIEKDNAAVKKSIDDNAAWEKKQKQEFYDWRRSEEEKLAELEQKRIEKTAELAKEKRAKLIAEELKTPGERNVERQDARAEANAEDRAIRRIAQRAQDKQNSSWRNVRMSNQDRDALANQLKQQRVADKQPQMEKDISEINASIKTMKDKIGVQ